MRRSADASVGSRDGSRPGGTRRQFPAIASRSEAQSTRLISGLIVTGMTSSSRLTMVAEAGDGCAGGLGGLENGGA